MKTLLEWNYLQIFIQIRGKRLINLITLQPNRQRPWVQLYDIFHEIPIHIHFLTKYSRLNKKITLFLLFLISLRSRGAETTVIMLQNGSGEENGLIDHEKMSCM